MFSTYLNKLEELIEKRDFLTFGLLAVGVLMGLLFIRFLFNRVVEYFSSENKYYNLMQNTNKPDLDTEDCFNDCNSTEILDSVKNDTLEPTTIPQELEALAPEPEAQPQELEPLATELEAEQQELEAFSEDNNKASDNLDLDLDMDLEEVSINYN